MAPGRSVIGAFQLDCSLSAARLSRAGSPLTPVFASHKKLAKEARAEKWRDKMHAQAKWQWCVHTQSSSDPAPLFPRVGSERGNNDRGLLTAGAWLAAEGQNGGKSARVGRKMASSCRSTLLWRFLDRGERVSG